MASPAGEAGPGPEAGGLPARAGQPPPPATRSRGGREPGAITPPPPPGPALPPPVPRRARRDLLTEADRLFADRAFQSVADRRDALVAEAERRRPPPRRDLLATPEGRLTLLREDLKWREAQLARLAEIWEIREREVASVDERIHAKDVDVQRARLEAEEALRKLDEARRPLGEKDREHGASIEGLLSEKFKEEKELIEVVAGSERRLHEQARELRGREERLARAEEAAAALQARIDGLAEEARAAAPAGWRSWRGRSRGWSGPRASPTSGRPSWPSRSRRATRCCAGPGARWSGCRGSSRRPGRP